MTPKLRIKEKSFPVFFGKYLVFDDNSHQMQPASMSNEKRYYTPSVLTNKVIYLRKDCGINPGERIRFIYNDRTNQSNKPVLCTSTYQAEAYDDITLRLELKESTINFDE